MEYPFNGATEELCREIGDPNYTVVFESLRQKYEVHYKYEHRDESVLLTDFDSWDYRAIRYLRRMHWEWKNGFNGVDDKYWLAEKELEKEQIDEDFKRNQVEPWAREVSHELWHQTGKRVF